MCHNVTSNFKLELTTTIYSLHDGLKMIMNNDQESSGFWICHWLCIANRSLLKWFTIITCASRRTGQPTAACTPAMFCPPWWITIYSTIQRKGFCWRMSTFLPIQSNNGKYENTWLASTLIIKRWTWQETWNWRAYGRLLSAQECLTSMCCFVTIDDVWNFRRILTWSHFTKPCPKTVPKTYPTTSTIVLRSESIPKTIQEFLDMLKLFQTVLTQIPHHKKDRKTHNLL